MKGLYWYETKAIKKEVVINETYGNKKVWIGN